METEEISISESNSNKLKSSKAEHIVFASILISLFYLYNYNYYLFHGTAEIFGFIIAGGILMISVGTYKFTKNDFFMFLGIGHLFIIIIDIFHTVTYGDISVLPEFVFDIDTKFWVAGRSVELVTYLLASIFLLKPLKKYNYNLIFAVYLIVTLFLVLDIIKFKTFIPTMRLEDTGITDVKIYFEYIVSTGFVICCILLYFSRGKMDKELFLFLEMSLISKVFSELSFTLYFNVTDFSNMIGHIFKVISYYFLYQGIIINGIQRPFEMININLDKADTEIKEKEKQRHYMEEVINQNEKCYEWIINNSSNGIVITKNRQLIYANATALRMLGANNLNEIIGKDATDFILDISTVLDELEDTLDSSSFEEVKLLKTNKDIFEVEYSVNKVTYRGEPAFLILLKDLKLNKEIKELKNDLIITEDENNKLSEYNRVLTEFFSNISHELKTPINVILSAVQLIVLKEKESNVDFMIQLNRLLGIIKQNCFRLIRLVGNLIDISKVDSGFFKLKLKNENVVTVIEDITLSVGDYIKSKGVNIIFDTDVEDKIIAIDADKIERIMLNLLSNAVKFTDEGDQIFVNIADGEELISIIVKDTGVGIPEEKLRQIFDRFAQVDDALVRNKEGSGIGLSLVKSLTEMHGGNVKVESEVGVGSQFIIKLPVKLTDESNLEEVDFADENNKIDKILIEFSDVYSFD